MEREKGRERGGGGESEREGGRERVLEFACLIVTRKSNYSNSIKMLATNKYGTLPLSLPTPMLTIEDGLITP